MPKMQRMKTMNSTIINSASALPKVSRYLCDEYRGELFDAAYLVGHIDFYQKEDGIGTKHSRCNILSLSHALSQGIRYDHKALDEISYLKMVTRKAEYGTFYGALDYPKKPQTILATHDPKGRVEFLLNGGQIDGHARDVERWKRVIPKRVAPKDQ